MDGLQTVSQNGQISAFLTMFVIYFCFRLDDEVDFDEDSEEDISDDDDDDDDDVEKEELW